MCIIMYKPLNMAFPEEATLKNCWDNNPHMGGFMYAMNGEVHIKKGYKTWETFLDALNRTRAETGDDVPYVCHFRISTQGYDTSCCQPFPLSSKMKNLRKSRVKTNIGIAHNGIIDITSDGAKDYSDTMKFITDYMVNIIRGLDWYKDSRNLKLIENLIVGSRLAILDKDGHCQLMGKGWVEHNGIHYSNSTYSYKKVTYSGYSGGYSGGGYYGGGYYGGGCYDFDDLYDDGYDYQKYLKSKETEETQSSLKTDSFDAWGSFLDPVTETYTFVSDEFGMVCPYTMEDNDSYCSKCSKKAKCSYVLACQKVSGLNG